MLALIPLSPNFRNSFAIWLKINHMLSLALLKNGSKESNINVINPSHRLAAAPFPWTLQRQSPPPWRLPSAYPATRSARHRGLTSSPTCWCYEWRSPCRAVLTGMLHRLLVRSLMVMLKVGGLFVRSVNCNRLSIKSNVCHSATYFSSSDLFLLLWYHISLNKK